jgi:glycosyltransferase involved in cell wall biosynthesis
MIENTKYRSALVTILFYVIVSFLITIIYYVKPEGVLWFILGTIAPLVLPILVVVILLKNIWQYYYKAKTNIFSIIIHSTVFLIYIFLIIKNQG